jgi:hypothetical protein
MAFRSSPGTPRHLIYRIIGRVRRCFPEGDGGRSGGGGSCRHLGTNRHKRAVVVLLKVAEDGSVFRNMMQRDRKGMNALRIGDLVYEGR